MSQSLFVGLVLLPAKDFWFYIINPFIAISHGITSPNLTTVVSMQAGKERQGEVMGINQSMLSLGECSAIVGGYLNALRCWAASAIWEHYAFLGLGDVLCLFLERKVRDSSLSASPKLIDAALSGFWYFKAVFFFYN
ncbi:MAG: hypothetical protein R2825_09300 [Saprospiraceae bacterium]